MYFHRKQSKSGRCLQLLESYRPSGGGSPRHRVVASLGDAEIPEEWFDGLSTLVASRLEGRELLLAPDLPPEGLAWVDRIVHDVERKRRDEGAGTGTTLDGVVLDRIDHSHSTPLGPLLVGLDAWEKLGMDRLLGEVGLNGAQRQAACALILGRLAEPLSEHAFYHWLPQSSLPDLLGSDVSSGGAQRYYRAGDSLLAKRAAIEAGLRERIGTHFGLTRTVFLYDLTNFHFEGSCAENPMAVRGRNKQKRNDCPQVVVGMVFDEFGFEVLHRTFAGNTADCTTLPGMAAALLRASTDECLTVPDRPTVVVDGGLATKDNLAELRKLGFHYLVNDKRARRGAWHELFREDSFEPVAGRGEGREVLVRHIDAVPDDRAESAERVVLCKSRGRRDKETAIRSQAEDRFLRDMQALAKRLATGRLKTAGGAERALGRVLAKHPRVARFYEATVADTGALALLWQRDDQRWEAEDELAGCYALRTTRQDLEGDELWRLYMTLCRAEDGFRTVKSDLGLRPAFHRVEDRVDAHVFVTVLAYQILRTILHRLESQGDNRRWPTLRRVLATHCYATIHLPLVDGTVRRIRKPGRPEQCQWDIYRKLGIDTMSGLPKSGGTVPTRPAPKPTKRVVTQKSKCW
jgi:transposase